MDRFAESLLVIIVIYKSTLEDCESFQSLLAMREEFRSLNLFIYDNSPISQELKNYEGLAITYFHDPENSGVSKAYNTGAEHAKKISKEWVLLLDQDTRFPNSILSEYRQAMNSNSNINLFVPVLKLKNGKIFSPSRYRFKRGFFLVTIKSGVHSLFNLAPVNSGMMVQVEAFFKVGGYNEKVKLDFADFQFVERFRKLYPNFFVLNVECEQDFSDDNNSFESQYIRFKYYCDGAKNVENKNFADWLQYNGVVIIRAIRLTLRFVDARFLGAYFKNFLFG